jgi:drug/metabolite transporter (DMT)-like permease
VALLLGVLVLGEPVTAGLLVGFPLVLLGSALATRRVRPRATAEATPPVPAGASEG